MGSAANALPWLRTDRHSANVRIGTASRRNLGQMTRVGNRRDAIFGPLQSHPQKLKVSRLN
jgi:hypothetical protein